MRTIAITGGIGTGKSSVARILIKMGFPVISADQVAHSMLEKGTVPYKKTVAEFGEGILDATEQINRRALGQIVFGDQKLKEKLERIIHPAVIARIKQYITETAAGGAGVLFIEVPLLYETGMESLFDQVWVVSATPAAQIKRLSQRDRLDEAGIRQRIAAQLPLTVKEARADEVIVNNSDLNHLRQQVNGLLYKLELI